MEKIDKDNLIALICSPDLETKNLGISLLLNNFDFPEKFDHIIDPDEYYIKDCSMSKKECLFYLQYLKNKKGLISLLLTIFEYNERNRKDR